MRVRSLLYFLVAATLVAAFWAWKEALPSANYPGSSGFWQKTIDAIYFSIQLFGGGFSDFALKVDNPPNPTPIALSIIRLLAFGLGLFLALLAVLSGFRARVFAWQRRLQTAEFDLVIGYGQVGRGLATALTRASAGSVRVIALCRQPTDFDQREARRQNIELYAGDARELPMHRRLPAAPLARARRIFVAAGSDTETLAIGRDLAAALPTRADRIWMNFEDAMLRERLRDLPNPAGQAAGPRPQTFSMAEATAEWLIIHHRPMLTARACGNARMHAVIVGFDQSTWPVMEQLVLYGTYPPPTYARPRLTVIDADGDRARAQWQARHSELARWADIDFIGADPSAIAWTHDDAILRAIEGLDPPSLYVFSRTLESLPKALGLHHAMAKGDRATARIFVIANTRTDTILHFGECTADLQDDVVLIGDPTQVADVSIACSAPITQLATAIHHKYSSDLPFAALSETLRVSNRRAAIHALDKLALLGFERADANRRAFGLSRRAGKRIADMLANPDGAELEGIGGFEHVRWCVDRTMDGWRVGPRDDAARRREQLDFGGARYGELAKTERDKDRDQIDAVAAWIERSGTSSNALSGRTVTREGPKAQWHWSGDGLALDLVAPLIPMSQIPPGDDVRYTIVIPAEPPHAPGETANQRAVARRAAYARLASSLATQHPNACFRFLRSRAEGHDWLGLVDPILPIEGATLPPLTLGFAGPRAFTPSPDIEEKLNLVITEQLSGDRPVRLVTGLAKGADALMIGLCRGKMRILGIATDATEEEEAQRLLVDHVDDGARLARTSDIHIAVARRIIASCDLLIAIDNGGGGGGPGGTADVIAQAEAVGRPTQIVRI